MRGIKFILFGIAMILAALPLKEEFSSLAYILDIIGAVFAFIGLDISEEKKPPKGEPQPQNTDSANNGTDTHERQQ